MATMVVGLGNRPAMSGRGNNLFAIPKNDPERQAGSPNLRFSQDVTNQTSLVVKHVTWLDFFKRRPTIRCRKQSRGSQALWSKIIPLSLCDLHSLPAGRFKSTHVFHHLDRILCALLSIND